MGIEREWTLISVHIMFPCQLLSNPIPRIVWEQDSPLQYTKHCIRLPILLLLLLFLLQEAGLTISPNPISIPLPPLLLPEPQSSVYPSPPSYYCKRTHDVIICILDGSDSQHKEQGDESGVKRNRGNSGDHLCVCERERERERE